MKDAQPVPAVLAMLQRSCRGCKQYRVGLWQKQLDFGFVFKLIPRKLLHIYPRKMFMLVLGSLNRELPWYPHPCNSATY